MSCVISQTHCKTNLDSILETAESLKAFRERIKADLCVEQSFYQQTGLRSQSLDAS